MGEYAIIITMKEKVTKEDIKKGFEMFYKEHGRYPTVQEIDAYPHLPSSRTLQRKYGGAVPFRKELGLETTNFTTGKARSGKMKKILARGNESEKEVYDLLVKQFGLPFVHREYFFTDDRRVRTDFFIYCKEGNFSVDVFYPDSVPNLIGCLNSKMKTYSGSLMLEYPVIFLQMNKNITQEDTERVIKNKKNKLPPFQKLMGIEEFTVFFKGKHARGDSDGKH